MRIAIFAPVFVRPTETFIYDATVELKNAGADVLVVTESRQTIEERPFDPVCEVPRTHRHNLRRLILRLWQNFPGRRKSDYVDLIQRSAIRRRIRNFQPDVILANYGEGGVQIAPIAQKLNIPLVVSFHGADASRRARDPQWRQKYKDMFTIASAVTGPSDYVCEKLIALGCDRERVFKIHYGIRANHATTTSIRSRSRGDPIRFLFVGRLAPKKDPVTLLHSFNKARNQLPAETAKLTIIGDGPLRSVVEELIIELNLQDCVDYLGRQRHDIVLDKYHAAHVYIQHSVTAPDGDEEGLPVSITEAISAGLPVISTHHSGIPEAVRHGETGYLVEEGDADKMSEYMVELANNPEICARFGQSGTRMAADEFAMAIVQQELRKLLAKVSSKPF